MPEVQIEMADFDPNYHQAQTENIHNSDHGFPHLDEEDAADYLKELQAILLDNESTFLENENFGQLKKGLISLDWGINNTFIPVNKEDVGSIIAFSLSTNSYYEGLARQNYMEFQSKIDQNSGEELDMNTKIHSTPKNNMTLNPKDYLEKRSSTNTQITGLQNQLINAKSTGDSKKKERIRLNDKTDVLDSEYQPHHIESEFLSYEKINFKLKWSTSKKDMKMKVFKNIFRVDHIHGNVQEYCHKDKNVDEKVLPKYSKNFLEDENIMNFYSELNELKKTLEYESANAKPRPRRQHPDISMESINSVYNVPSPTNKMQKLPSVLNPTDMNTSMHNITSQADIVITPMQPPVHHLTEKYKSKKVFTNLGEENLDFEVTIYFPKKFEALRKFYCGSHEDFIKSIMKTKDWADNSGGKQKGKFFKSGDEKYIFKEIRTGDIRMFTEFAPRYFDYLCKSFFHNFPCALAKILGAYKISIRSNSNKNKVSEKYYVITENLNYGITNEKSILRYDLKGSTRNRYIKTEDWALSKPGQGKVLLDTNFMLDNKARPMVLKNVYYKILMICINNDSLFFSRSNIVDYSLLVIIDKEKKTVRFGIIDYIQQYTMEKMVESKFKAIIAAGDVPTIVDPNPYKTRFQEAIRKYFIGV